MPVCAQIATGPVGGLLPSLPEVHSPVSLKAVTDPETGKSAFSFAGREVPPVIRGKQGGKIEINYENEMSSHSHEICVDGPCRNMTNLHFHGLHISPNAPQDDVISMMAMPGESLHYLLDIPRNQPPGLYWYHTHPHGESYQQSLDGMSGAIVIDGIENYYPEVKSMKERILVLRDFDLSANRSSSAKMAAAVSLSPIRCGKVTEEPERIFTVNGAIRPKIPIAPGERQFWRIVNASPDLYADVAIDSSTMTVIALDGMPLAYHDPNRRTETLDHVLLAPAGRVEAIVEGPAQGQAALRSRCVDTGPDGDPNQEMVLADLDESAGQGAASKATSVQAKATGKSFLVPEKVLHDTEQAEPGFTVRFTEDKHGFYINNKKYGPSDPPMAVVKTGKYVHWKVVNDTDEIHPFHIHQVHFLVYGVNGKNTADPIWMDTTNVPARGEIDLVMDFTDPIIKGMSLFHCHLLKHEDKGMMAKILFQ